MAVNGNLHDSAKNKQDVFYTRLQLIEDELRHYRAHFAMNFNALGLKSLTATSADGGGVWYNYGDDTLSWQ